ncbi:hypothetical protein BDV98DRAFT_557414 [Pterulicium gracile]|uniref:Uncharacterized protein n=1 Tax=Pterulicium gracile TaxID=1884261 RepID=A0A5C3QYT6_9AGAR|nr:hypothetical protein BDV98DRAFT_557414 [Pterula gracilis]
MQWKATTSKLGGRGRFGGRFTSHGWASRLALIHSAACSAADCPSKPELRRYERLVSLGSRFKDKSRLLIDKVMRFDASLLWQLAKNSMGLTLARCNYFFPSRWTSSSINLLSVGTMC